MGVFFPASPCIRTPSAALFCIDRNPCLMDCWCSKPAEPLGPERGMKLNSGGFFFSGVSAIFRAGRIL